MREAVALVVVEVLETERRRLRFVPHRPVVDDGVGETDASLVDEDEAEAVATCLVDDVVTDTIVVDEVAPLVVDGDDEPLLPHFATGPPGNV